MRASVLMGLCAAFALTGCDLPNPAICTKPPQLDLKMISTLGPVDVGGWQMNAENCVHRWAYRLARSGDAAETIADAVMGGCRDPVSRVSAALERQVEKPGSPRPTMENSRTGVIGPIGPTVHEQFRSTALFHVVQARAGHCRPT
jgi:hypothetical protein